MRLEKLRVLSDEEVSRIHENSLEVLEKTGVMVQSEEALDKISRLGLSTDPDRFNVQFPRRIVNDCLENVPSHTDLYDRDGTVSARLGKGGVYAASGHNAICVQDCERHARRNAAKQDAGELSRGVPSSETVALSIPF